MSRFGRVYRVYISIFLGEAWKVNLRFYGFPKRRCVRQRMMDVWVLGICAWLIWIFLVSGDKSFFTTLVSNLIFFLLYMRIKWSFLLLEVGGMCLDILTRGGRKFPCFVSISKHPLICSFRIYRRRWRILLFGTVGHLKVIFFTYKLLRDMILMRINIFRSQVTTELQTIFMYVSC